MLYPSILPFNSGMLQVSDIHTLYYEEVGNPDAPTILFLHGGPGGGCNETYRQIFDPQKWRVVLFDQRGCGRSTPHAELKDNTTWDLVEDIEKLRSHLSIKNWAVFGGSWGSTLALSYAVTHPQKVNSLFLRGIFMLRDKELQWFYQKGAHRFFPEAWQKYVKVIPENERDDLITAYYKRLTSSQPDIVRKAAQAWAIWEGSTSKLIQDKELIEHHGEDSFAQAFARIECHYFINKGFFPKENYLLDQCHKIKHIPTLIVQGRYDMVCPLESAWELHQALPDSKLRIIEDAGHSVMEKGILNALQAAVNM